MARKVAQWLHGCQEEFIASTVSPEDAGLGTFLITKAFGAGMTIGPYFAGHLHRPGYVAPL
jgi:hypothetical protein